MARYSHKGHDTIWYDITQNIVIRYDTIWSESASLYVRTASKQATAHNTGAPSFCLSTLSPLQVPGYWPSGEATVVGDWRRDGRRAAGVPWSPGLFSRATVSTGCQTTAAVESLHSCYCLAVTRPPSQSTHRPTREAGQLLPICHFACSGYAAWDSLCRCRRQHWRHWRRLRVVRNIDFVWGVIIAIKICHDTTSISRYSIRYDISCNR